MWIRIELNTLILTWLPDDRHQRIGSVYRTCIILYLVTFYTLPSGQDMLKLRYRVRGMTSQEKSSTLPLPTINSYGKHPPKSSKSWKISKVHFIQFDVTFDTWECIICTCQISEFCYISMYNMIQVVYLMIPCAVSWIRLWKNLWKTGGYLCLYHLYLTNR